MVSTSEYPFSSQLADYRACQLENHLSTLWRGSIMHSKAYRKAQQNPSTYCFLYGSARWPRPRWRRQFTDRSSEPSPITPGLWCLTLRLQSPTFPKAHRSPSKATPVVDTCVQHLIADTYQVQAEAKGFNKTTVDNVVVYVDTAAQGRYQAHRGRGDEYSYGDRRSPSAGDSPRRREHHFQRPRARRTCLT